MKKELQGLYDLCISNGIAESDLKPYFATIESNLKTKRYGLVWEEQLEDIAAELKNKFPILLERKDLSINADPNGLTNCLIEGDNYESLTFLKNSGVKVDCIYIDPPYNTGNKDFVYNDKYIDTEDTWRHSSWLSFMNKRLKLAKELLTEDGVIFISIDDNEQANLKILCDEIFGENNFIENFLWEHGKGKKTKQTRTLQQYTLCYAKNRSKLNTWKEEQYLNYEFKNPDNDPKGSWFSGSISFNENRSNKNHKNYYKVVSPSGVVWERQWMVEEDVMVKLIENKDIYFGDSPNFNKVPRKKIRQGSVSDIIPKNIIRDVGSTSSAEKEVFNILGSKLFDYPKPVNLIKKLISITNKNKDITVLDFFAGSGTTGHAILELNKDDDGNRKFILCTNNENNIAETVTHERLKRVIQGYTTPKGKMVNGIHSNLKYYKVENLVSTVNQLELVDEIIENIIPFIQFKHNAWEKETLVEELIKLTNEKEDIYVHMNTLYLCDAFYDSIKNLGKPTTLYIYDGLFDMVDEDRLGNVKVLSLTNEFYKN